LRAGAFVALLLAACAVGAASAASPVADQKRALAIGLTRADAGAGWSEVGKRSPYLLDLGSSLGAAANGPAGPGLTACVGMSPAELKTGADLSITATAMTQLLERPTSTNLASLVIVEKPGAEITPGEWRSQFTLAEIKRCVLSEFGAVLAHSSIKVRLARAQTLAFATGSPLSSAYRVILRLSASTRSWYILLDAFMQGEGRDLTETLLVSGGVPPNDFEHRITRLLAKRLHRFA
jgi:hypothetical protein